MYFLPVCFPWVKCECWVSKQSVLIHDACENRVQFLKIQDCLIIHRIMNVCINFVHKRVLMRKLDKRTEGENEQQIHV